MKKYSVMRTFNVDGQTFEAGAEVSVDDIHAGTIESCVRVGHLVELPDPEPKGKGKKTTPPAAGDATEPEAEAKPADDKSDPEPKGKGK